MNFIFFWRLTHEKGFDLLVQSLRSFDELPSNFFIFGDGTMKGMLFNTFAESPIFEDCSGWDEERIQILLTNSPHPNPLPEGEGIQDSHPPLPLGEGLGVRATEKVALSHKIYFFSWRSLDTITKFLAISHFSLMPSRFLETFGLSALESLSAGVPVIGFKKWGLVPFIEDSLAITWSETEEWTVQNLTDTIRDTVRKHSLLSPSTRGVAESRGEIISPEWKIISERAKTISERYTEDRWIREVQELLPDETKKILLVSDYIAPLGGIETHITDITAALRRHGYTVETFGWHIRKDRFLRIKRLLGLVVSCYNLPFAMRFQKYLDTYQPDFIWFHNVSRFLGPAVVHEAFKKAPLIRGVVPSLRDRGVHSTIDEDFSPKTAITYHELGAFTPFPSKTEREDSVPARWSLPLFLNISRSLNIITHAAIVCKFLQLSWLRRELQQIDSHIVPSAFMRKYVRDIIEIPEDRIVTLEHFRG